MAMKPVGNKPVDKEQQRALRDLRQQGQAALTWGLPNPASEAAVVGIGLLLRDRLIDDAEPQRASAAAALASTLLDKTTAKMPQAASVACTKGCSFCCHSAVSVSAPEVFWIVRHLASATELAAGLDTAAVTARAKSRTASSLAATVAKRDACPLLINNACGVHAARPMGCRQFFSTSAMECEAALEGKRDAFPFVPGAVNAGLIVRALLLGAARSLDLRAQTYELSGALVAALSQADAEVRWLGGEDVLAGALEMPQPPNMQSSVERWSGMLKGLVE